MEKADSDELIHLQPGIADIADNGNAPLEFPWQKCGSQLVRQTPSLIHPTDSECHRRERQHLAEVGRLMKVAQGEIFPKVTDVPKRK